MGMISHRRILIDLSAINTSEKMPYEINQKRGILKAGFISKVKNSEQRK